ncbi:DUF805 domain-containing protein [Arenibaculum pallidiluteum]|uniref:DUF805 domain-containing protein n=1 Tax=Arenibaculum pallidiluteum TaxID=2812559 RepID=UPI001A97CE24|nr:DUF805 domain-containing protein [Arenibaculum pallidiluteum]
MPLKTLLLSFEGRIGRRTFWQFNLALFLASLAVVVAEIVMEVEGPSALLTLLSLYPSLAVYAKRWHDRDKSAWWLLLGLVPVIGQIWALVETGFFPGTPGPNRFGEAPAV